MKSTIPAKLGVVLLTVLSLGISDAFAQKTCRDWGLFRVGDLKAENNVWGTPNAEHSQCIEHADNMWTINWKWPKMKNYQVRSYPLVWYGKRPWYRGSTTQRLPMHLGNVKPISARVRVRKFKATGHANLAFDMWITGTGKNPSGSDVTREVMIWLRQKGGLTPAGNRRVKSVSIGGMRWEVWYDKRAQPLISFYPKSFSQVRYKLPIDKFMLYLIRRKWVKESEYLSSIELGPEVFGGSGETQFSLEYR